MRKRRGFSGLDLLIISAVLLFAGGFAVLLAEKVDTTRNRVQCASNLRMIGQAILLYANENRGAYPRATYDPAKADHPVAFTNPKPELTEDEKTKNIKPTFCAAGPAANDVTAAMFLLILTQEITPDVFTCPTARAIATTQPSQIVDPKTECNFSEPGQLDYSFVNVYPNETAVDQGYKIDTMSRADLAIAADINPGVDELLTTATTAGEEAMKKINSPNHEGDGQNVLFADGHVEFQQQPFCGVERDNIYTYGKSGETSGGEGIVGSPTNEKDSVLLPTAKQTGPKAPMSKPE
jgi:prepilin-type processing-associated H-X9-DG protein